MLVTITCRNRNSSSVLHHNVNSLEEAHAYIRNHLKHFIEVEDYKQRDLNSWNEIIGANIYTVQIEHDGKLYPHYIPIWWDELRK